MASYKIQSTQFDPALIPKVELASRESKPPPPDPTKGPNDQPKGQPFRESAYEYTYTEKLADGTMVPRIAEFIVEGPVLRCVGGIRLRPNQMGGDQASILVTFDLSKPEVAAFAGPQADSFISRLETWCKQMLIEQWGKAFPGQPRQTIDTIGGYFTPTLFRKTDGTTGMVMEGKNPTKFFNLTYYGKPGDKKFRCTPFTLPTSDPKAMPEVVSWEILQRADFDFIPAIKVRRNFIMNNKATIQMDIVSGVIMSLTPTGEMVVQRDTAARLGADMSLIERLHAQIAAIRKDTSTEKKEEATTEPTAKPTLSEPAVQPSLAPPTTTITTGHIHIPIPSASALLNSAPLALPTVTSALPVPSGVSGLPVPQFAGLPVPTTTN